MVYLLCMLCNPDVLVYLPLINARPVYKRLTKNDDVINSSMFYYPLILIAVNCDAVANNGVKH